MLSISGNLSSHPVELPTFPGLIAPFKGNPASLISDSDSDIASTSTSTDSSRASSQSGLSSVPSSEAGGESEDDFVFSSTDDDDEDEETLRMTTAIEALEVVEEVQEEEEDAEDEDDVAVEDPHTRHARAVIAARALYAGIWSLSSFTSPCGSRQELVEDDSLAAFMGLQPMQLVLNTVATPKACKSPTTTRSPSSTVRLVSALTSATAVSAAPSTSSSSHSIVTPCSTPTLSHPVAYTLVPARPGFLRLQ